jgi:signal transduction histidine kinase
MIKKVSEMKNKQLKWMILVIPTIVIGGWEYVRHEFLLPYISMEVGNWLSPVIVLIVTIALLVPLFNRYEQLHEQLKREKAEKAILQEQERIARELHDGIAQTLFLSSVQVKQMKQQKYPNWESLEKNLREMHEYIRYSISNLKKSKASSSFIGWKRQMEQLVEQFQLQTGSKVELHIDVNDSDVTPKEKIELFSCMREGLLNIQKHTDANHVRITLCTQQKGWLLEIVDNGQGFTKDPFQYEQKFGLKIMQERVAEINGSLSFVHENGETKLLIQKGG